MVKIFLLLISISGSVIGNKNIDNTLLIIHASKASKNKTATLIIHHAGYSGTRLSSLRLL